MKMWQELARSTKAPRLQHLQNEGILIRLKPPAWLNCDIMNLYSKLCVADLPSHQQETICILTTHFCASVMAGTDAWKRTLHRCVSDFHASQPACSNQRVTR
jgi:hypothetical protein